MLGALARAGGRVVVVRGGLPALGGAGGGGQPLHLHHHLAPRHLAPPPHLHLLNSRHCSTSPGDEKQPKAVKEKVKKKVKEREKKKVEGKVKMGEVKEAPAIQSMPASLTDLVAKESRPGHYPRWTTCSPDHHT